MEASCFLRLLGGGGPAAVALEAVSTQGGGKKKMGSSRRRRRLIRLTPSTRHFHGDLFAGVTPRFGGLQRPSPSHAAATDYRNICNTNSGAGHRRGRHNSHDNEVAAAAATSGPRDKTTMMFLSRRVGWLSAARRTARRGSGFRLETRNDFFTSREKN